MKVKLDNVRIAFPNVFEPRSVNQSADAKFSASFLMPPDHPAVEKLKKAMAEVAKEKWGGKAETIFKQLKAQDRLALHDGESKGQYAGFEGNLFVNASNPIRPLVVDGNRNPLDPTSGKPYAGCYVNAMIDIWPQDNQYGKRINAGLLGVQFAGHGERLAGGGVASEDDFEPVPDAEDGSEVFGSEDKPETGGDEDLFG